MKYFSWIPAVIIMILIFCFSTKPADNSNANSLFVVNGIIKIYENITNTQMESDQNVELEGTLNLIVRKSAHFSEYALLAIAIAFHLAVWKKRGKGLYFLPVLLSALYASTDEFHQTFVAGRAGLLKDVFIDTSGAAFGSLIVTLIILVLARRNKRMKKIRIS